MTTTETTDEPCLAETATRIVIVGGVAGGMSAAARARRLDEHAQIVVLEQGDYVSFANCGLPYHLSGEIAARDALLLHTPESLAASLNLDVRTGHQVTGIDTGARKVTIATRDGDYALPYDALLLAPGAVAVRPPIEGLDHPAVYTLRTVPDVDALSGRIEELLIARGWGGPAPRAVVIGAGFIGLEAVEALTSRGLQVHLVELADHVLPPIDAELAPLLADELAAHGVDLRLGVSAQTITQTGALVEPAENHGENTENNYSGAVNVNLSDGTSLAADLVIVNIGVRPASTLASEAGLELGPTGAIRVDTDQHTSDPHIWAVGDAVEVTQAITGARIPVPLAGPANRQGRRAADSMCGRRTTPQAAVLGTAIVRVFSLTAATTGANQATLARAGIAHEVVHIHPGHHAGYYPGSEQIHLVASFAPDGTLLGAQGVGRAGVDKRIDILATAIRAGMTADDLAELELAYAPPYGSAKDPVNMLGFVAQNVLDAIMPQWQAQGLHEAMATTLVLDVRSASEYDAGHIHGALNVPHLELRARLEEVRTRADGRTVSVHCASGVRSYLATRVLLGEGFQARNLSGGWLTLQAVHPNLCYPPRRLTRDAVPSPKGASSMRTHTTRTWSRPVAAAAMTVAAITGISACSSSAPASTMASSSTSEIGSNSSTGQHLAAAEFATASTKPGTIVIDVRTPAEFAAGHLPKAQNIDLKGSDFATRIAALDKNATYAVYCHSGQRSAAAMKQMAAADFTHSYDLTGGITAWQSFGGPVVTGNS